MQALKQAGRKRYSDAYTELAALWQQETIFRKNPFEGFSTQEELFKSFNVKPLEQSNDNSQLTKEVVQSEKKSRKIQCR